MNSGEQTKFPRKIAHISLCSKSEDRIYIRNKFFETLQEIPLWKNFVSDHVDFQITASPSILKELKDLSENLSEIPFKMGLSLMNNFEDIFLVLWKNTNSIHIKYELYSK